MPRSYKEKIISGAARRKVSTKTRLSFVMKLSSCSDVPVHKLFLDRVSLELILAFCCLNTQGDCIWACVSIHIRRVFVSETPLFREEKE